MLRSSAIKALRSSRSTASRLTLRLERGVAPRVLTGLHSSVVNTTRWQSTDSKGSNGASQTETNKNFQTSELESEAKAEAKLESTEKKVDDMVNSLKSTVEAKDKQLSEIKDAYLRAMAEMENTRKRHERQLEEKKDYAITSLARELVSSIDILNVALRSVPNDSLSKGGDLKDLYTGLEMTQRDILKTLNKVGVEQFDPTGEKFDPNTAEAMFQVPIADKEDGTVFVCEQIGYKIKGRVLRPAKVGIVKK